MWLKKKPNISSLKTFGEEVYFYILKRRDEKKYFRRMMKTQKDFESGFLKKAKLKYIEM